MELYMLEEEENEICRMWNEEDDTIKSEKLIPPEEEVQPQPQLSKKEIYHILRKLLEGYDNNQQGS
jgi:hypothetical protein